MGLLRSSGDTVTLTVRIDRELLSAIHYDAIHDRHSDMTQAKRTLSAGIDSVDVDVEDDDVLEEPDDPRTVTGDDYIEFVLAQLSGSGR